MSAVISPCGKYRYYLSREGGPSKNMVAFVMLNPSTADADIDDATIRRCRDFARGAGFVVVNLYAYRATKPKDMHAADDPVGPDNWQWLMRIADSGYKIICAWGAGGDVDKEHTAICAGMLRYLPDGSTNVLYCLGVTKDGQPRHPLYVRGDAPIVPWVLP